MPRWGVLAVDRWLTEYMCTCTSVENNFTFCINWIWSFSVTHYCYLNVREHNFIHNQIITNLPTHVLLCTSCLYCVQLMRSELSLYFSRLNSLVMSLSTNQISRDIELLLQQVTTYDLYSEESNLVIIFLK